jgi:hypothetical protein
LQLPGGLEKLMLPVKGWNIFCQIKSRVTSSGTLFISPLNYLTATDKDAGLIINFGEKKVEVKRKVSKLPENSTNKESR